MSQISGSIGVRQRALTPKGAEQYDERKSKFKRSLKQLWGNITWTVEKIQDINSLDNLERIEKDLLMYYETYVLEAKNCLAFMDKMRTQESKDDSELQISELEDDSKFFEKARAELLRIRKQIEECADNRTVNSRHSNLSTEIAKKRAKAEAEREKMRFTKREIEMKKKKAELEAELLLNEQEKQIAAAEVELNVLEAEESEIESGEVLHNSRENDHLGSLHKQDNMDQIQLQRTAEYKRVQATDNCEKTLNVHAQTFVPNYEELNKFQRTKDFVDSQAVFNPLRKERLDIDAEQFVSDTTGARMSDVSDIARFLLKKDLLLSSLVTFNDKPESYPSWKTSFKGVIRELCLAPVEEIDLLVKWLGPESSKQVASIKIASASCPSEGLRKAWERLDERYGSPEMIEAAVKAKLANFPKLTNKDCKKLYELYDILSEIEAIKENPKYFALLAYYDSSSGVLPIVHKLPYGIQEKWTSRAARYKEDYDVVFPPFSFFVHFVKEMSKTRNDPSFTQPPGPQITSNTPVKTHTNFRHSVNAKKTLVASRKEENKPESGKHCVLHKTNHSLNECRAFQTKTFGERKQILKENNICFKCCETNDHRYKDCKFYKNCLKCGSDMHATAMHLERVQQTPTQHGGERKGVNSKCTQICGSTNFAGKSCAKLVPVTVFSSRNPEVGVKAYAILDEQSNKTLAKSELFDMLDLRCKQIEYCLTSCSGKVATSGRTSEDFSIVSHDSSVELKLPSVIECNQIPDIRDEIPTPDVARHYDHLNKIAEHIPEVDDKREILLLIGRDVADAHHVQEQIIGLGGTPYAQKLAMGWVIVGEACLGKVHKPNVINVNKTYVAHNKRPTLFPPCTSRIDVREKMSDPLSLVETKSPLVWPDKEDKVFEKTDDDDKVGWSAEDKGFMKIMEDRFEKIDGKWSAPLPFLKNRKQLPNNRAQALTRAKVLESTFKKNPKKQRQYVDFMGSIIENGHAEVAPPVGRSEECWYLPHFGVFHPKKPEKIRVVFDSSAKFHDVSLNDVLLSGPNLMNNLLGVLLRFRKEKVAIVADIEQMFYCFQVSEEHRNYLRFFWYENNDPQNSLIEYRMCVHVFGNKPSPSVATYGLRKTAEICAETYGPDVTHFVSRNFYVDDGLASLPTNEAAVDLMQRTQAGLQKEGSLRLHKIMSNEKEVMDSFPAADLASNLKDLDLSAEDLPVQRSLGLLWNLIDDEFNFQISSEKKPYTRRGVLSVVNSIYDPLGFVAPVTIQGKLLLRDLMAETKGWDDPLPRDRFEEWNQWRESLKNLEKVKIPRAYVPISTTDVEKKDLHIFSDASEKAIAACAYILEYSQEQCHIGFVLGKAKVAPKCGHTIPRLELCAAVLAVELWETIVEEIEIQFDEVHFHTDSKIVLGYIHNQKRRFYMYVGNRVQRICQSTEPEQWTYIRSELNPADCATRPSSEVQQKLKCWLEGPQHLKEKSEVSVRSNFPLVDADDDREVRPMVNVMNTKVNVSSGIGTSRFERFSSWKRLVSAVALLKRVCRSRVTEPPREISKSLQSVHESYEAETFIIRAVQQEAYGDEIASIRLSGHLSDSSRLSTLSPSLDENGLLRVGGRLDNSELNYEEKHPIILPKDHHVSMLLVRHHHEKVAHQGRHFTEGAIRAAGLWIVGSKRLVNSVIHQCVKCRKLRGKVEIQKMSDLPSDRVKPCPPFTYVGVDVFGPWHVVARRTRGGMANSKRWAVLFTCLACRAIHIEVIDAMTSSAFINALRRFVSIRGNVKEFRSDRGSNFVGSVDSLNIQAINVEDGLGPYLNSQKTVWVFNPPHSSHMGGVWERMIGVTRRILEAMMAEPEAKHLTHEVLTTLLAEVSAIVNARPLVSVSADPEDPELLSPAAILTHKSSVAVEPLKDVDTKLSYRSQWNCVQAMADKFWVRWRRDYLQNLQTRVKWCNEKQNIKVNDVVLLKDKSVCRNDWPVGVVEEALSSSDGLVRKAVIRIVRDGKSLKYTRPISELVVLCSDEN